MNTLRLPLDTTDGDFVDQLLYALPFASEDIAEHSIENGNELVVTLAEGADVEDVRAKVEKLVARYSSRKFGLKEIVHFEQRRDLPVFDAYQALLDARLVTEVGPGHVVVRGLAARVLRTVEARVLSGIAARFDAEPEFYPSTIMCSTLERIHHFTSFPEHVDFVSHLREDVDVIGKFAADCREDGWKSEHHDGAMAPIRFAICPSCCYHCYEGMQDWEMEKPGRCATMVVNCHRYEGGNLTTMSRLRAFHQRDVVWVGHPKYVRDSRAEADEMLIQWAKDWELDCSFENANDMFFTDDYEVKASFQRQQQVKRELRLRIPFEERAISVSSSNFHAATFGRAFDIKVDGRPATSACMGWGYERWVYAIFCQFGLDPTKWPEGLRHDLENTPEVCGG